MRYEISESKDFPGDWRVEATNVEGYGESYVTLFCGPLAQERAQEFMAWKTTQLARGRALSSLQRQFEQRISEDVCSAPLKLGQVLASERTDLTSDSLR